MRRATRLQTMLAVATAVTIAHTITRPNNFLLTPIQRRHALLNNLPTLRVLITYRAAICCKPLQACHTLVLCNTLLVCLAGRQLCRLRLLITLAAANRMVAAPVFFGR